MGNGLGSDPGTVAADPRVFKYFQEEAAKAKAMGQKEGGRVHRQDKKVASASIDAQATPRCHEGKASRHAGEAANVSAASVDRVGERFDDRRRENM